MAKHSLKERMTVNPFTLTFCGCDAPLEKPFRSLFNAESRIQVRTSIIFGFVLIALFAIWDRILVPGQTSFASVIRFGLLTPLIFIGGALTYHKNVDRLFPALQIILILLVGVGLASMTLLTPSNVKPLYYGGIVLAVMYGYVFLRLRFVSASICCWIIVAIYEIIACGFTDIPQVLLISNAFFLITANCIGMVGSYTIEWHQRKGFYLAHHLKHEQEKVTEINKDLKQRVNERTNELRSANIALEQHIKEIQSLEEQTRQAQKMESIGLLAGGVAHDFNNILTIIVGSAELLSMGTKTAEKTDHYLKAITKSAHRGVQLVRQLLTFARKAETQYSQVNLNEITTDVVDLLVKTFSKSISVVTNFCKDLPLLVADAGQMHQVIMNICINARDAMPLGGTITIETGGLSGARVRSFYSDAVDSDYVYVSVTDTGTGMTEETRLKIFEPFFTTKEPGKGTGLGLSVVYGIVQSHHGYIQVKSTPGKGSEFMMFFPVGNNNQVSSLSKSVVSIPKTGNGETILVIDDEKDIVGFLKDLLEHQGYKVLAANGGEAGIEAFKKLGHEISLVLCDKEMPATGGEKVFTSIHTANPKLPFILVTGLIEPSERESFLARGMRNVLLKPVIAEDLLRLIDKTLVSE